MNTPTIFTNTQFGESRFIQEGDGFVVVAKDVVEGVGNVWNRAPAIAHVPEQWRGSRSVSTPSGIQEMSVLTEEGLYFYLGRCDKPAALQYQMWIAGEVVPNLRRHGAHFTPDMAEKIIANPDIIIELANIVKAERAKSAAFEAQAAADRPKVIFADAVDASSSAILIGVLAKLLRQNGVEIGQNRLFAWLREHGYLMKSGDDKNMPTQRGMELGLFEIKERTIINPDGSNRVTRTTMVTGKGQIYFINRFKGTEAAA
jgi:anti-repressor protein